MRRRKSPNTMNRRLVLALGRDSVGVPAVCDRVDAPAPIWGVTLWVYDGELGVLYYEPCAPTEGEAERVVRSECGRTFDGDVLRLEVEPTYPLVSETEANGAADERSCADGRWA